MNEFTAILNDDNTFDIQIDGERLWCRFNAQDLKEFAEDFIASNTEEP